MTKFSSIPIEIKNEIRQNQIKKTEKKQQWKDFVNKLWHWKHSVEVMKKRNK